MMKAVILAAGYATRLYPLTKNMPKALLNINDKPLIDYIVDQLHTIGAIDEIIVVSNSKFAPHFNEWACGKTSGKTITVLDDGTTDETNKKGAIGDIQFAIENAHIKEDLMVIAGDNLFTFKLLDYFDFYQSVQKDCVVAKKIDDVALLRQFAVAKLDAHGKVLELVEKPPNPPSDIAVFAAYCYTKETVKLFDVYLKEGNNPDAPGYFVQWLYKRKDVYAYEMNGACYDIGTVAAYEDALRLFQ